MMKFTITVSASSANIGPGFDCTGMALNRYNRFTFEQQEKPEFVGFDEEFRNENNLVYKGYEWALRFLNVPKTKNWKVTYSGEVPVGKGFGSSSTCIVAGVAAAFEAAEIEWSKEDLARIASLFEGHPDNVCPAVFGGFAGALIDEDEIYVTRFPIHPDLQFCALIPGFRLSTQKAREVIPKTQTLCNAQKNLARALFLPEAFRTGDPALLNAATQDCLHQPYRAALIEGYEEARAAARASGALAVFLSGAGPILLAVSDRDITVNLSRRLSEIPGDWHAEPIEPDRSGIRLEGCRFYRGDTKKKTEEKNV